MRIKKYSCLLLALWLLFLSGCSVNINVDTMLTPPKLSGEQEQIYQALQDTTGSAIRLKYPKSGSYLSAFIIADIDNDNGDEAIVFYEKTNNTSAGLRINILDKIDDTWQSICDRSTDGTEIEKVMISQLGSHDRINIIIGYSTANQSEKYISVYHYEDNYLEQTFSHSYALFDIAEISNARHEDLILLDAASATQQAYAAVYLLDEEGHYHEYKYRFSDNYTDYQQLIYGKYADGRIGFYIDAATGTSQLQTEVLSLEETETDAQLVNLLQRSGSTVEETVRRAGLFCQDIDGDNLPEIPVQCVFAGYEEAAESEQIRMTSWLSVQDTGIFTEYNSYYNSNDGYLFILPESWQDTVTVRNDMIQDELQFCVYDGVFSEDMPILLRIYVAYDTMDRDDHLSDGYQLFHTKGTASYLVKAEAGQVLSLGISQLLPYFQFLD